MNDELGRQQHPRAMSMRALPLALTLILLLAVVTLAVIQVRGWDGATNADGVSYLDLAARYRRGEWSAMANGYWSPLYPVLLAAAQGVSAWLPGGPRSELWVVFTVNVALFAVVVLAFARLARLIFLPIAAGQSRAVLAMRIATAGTICVWSLIRLVGATTITPDGLLAAVLLLVAADLVDVAGPGPRSARRDVRFGALLAVGYWTKAVFLPVAFVAIAAYAVAGGRAARRRAVPRVMIAMILLAAPLVAMQSWSQGRPSFGETGRLNYRWYVGNTDHAPQTVEPVEATRARTTPVAVALASVPGAVLFTGKTPGSFPYWYDPSRYEPTGIGPLSLDAQLVMFFFNFHWLRAAAGLLLAFAAVALAAGAARRPARWNRLYALVPAVTTLGLYLLTHPEGRMGAASLACVLLVMTTLFDVGAAERRRPLAIVECIALGALGAVALGRSSNRLPARTTNLTYAGELARQITAAGVRPGDRVGVVGEAYGLRWAHETGSSIVLTLPASTYKSTVTDTTIAAAVRETAERGYVVTAVLIPLTAGVRSDRAVKLDDGWSIWRP